MNCLEFERLLDAGEPQRLPADAHAHAAECAHCTRSLAIAVQLEAALTHAYEAGSAPAPAGFTDRVMTRVAAVESRGARALLPFDALPWWVRAAAEPAVALACGVAALFLWRGNELLAGSRAWATALAEASRRGEALALLPSLAPLAQAFTGPLAGRDAWVVATVMVVAIAPVLALAALASWRLGERFVALVAPVRGL